MQARVKSSYRFSVVRAFGGVPYTKKEWKEVPAGFEGAALKHDLLDTRMDPALEEVHPEPIPAVSVPVSEPPRRSYTRRSYKSLAEKAEEDQ